MDRRQLCVETLGAYGRLCLFALRTVHNAAKHKGQEHAEYLMFRRCGWTYREWRRHRDMAFGKNQ